MQKRNCLFSRFLFYTLIYKCYTIHSKKFKIRDDGKLPRTICPGCNIQLEATVQFFKLVVDGQRKLREMWKHEVEQQRKAERLRNKKENAELETEGMEMDSTAQYNEDQQYEQQIIVKSNNLSSASC